MTIGKTKKSELVTKFRKSSKDTGSTAIQVALLTERIRDISEHLQAHRKDYSSQVGLLKLVSQRKRLLAYLKKTDLPGYAKLIKQLELRK